MSDFQIKTAQNVLISQNLAGVGQRIMAVLLDLFFLSLFYYFVIYLINYAKFDKLLSGWSFVAILTLPYFLYYPLLQYWNNGQTLGKQLINIRIVKQDNSHPRLGDFLIRWVFRIFEINMIPGLGLIVMLFSDKNQRLGDMVAGTVVVTEQKKSRLNHSIFEELNQTYQPVFTQASTLKETEVQIIKSVLVEAKKLQKKDLLRKLSYKIELLLQIKRPKNMSYIWFIETVLKDYNYYAGK